MTPRPREPSRSPEFNKNPFSIAFQMDKIWPKELVLLLISPATARLYLIDCLLNGLSSALVGT
jgi:hypothetical protein